MANKIDSEAQEIIETIGRVNADPSLRAELEAAPNPTLDRLGLVGHTRHAVAAAFALTLVAAPSVGTLGYWQN